MSRRVWAVASIGALLPLGCGDSRLVQCRRLMETVAPAAALTLTPSPSSGNTESTTSPPPTAIPGGAPGSTPRGTDNSSTDNSSTDNSSTDNSSPAAVADRLEALALAVRGLSLGDRTLRDLQTRFDTYFTDSSRLLRDFAQAKSNPVPAALARLQQQAEDLQAREATLIAETNRYCAQ